LTNLLLQVVLSFVGTIGFSIIFNVPRKELLLCGAAGASGWLVYQIIINAAPGAAVAATLFASMTTTYISRILSFVRKMPSTVYMIPAVIPLVPGAGIYYTMFHAVMGDNSESLLWGIETLRTAGLISVGLLIILSLPRQLFSIGSKNHK